MPLQDLLLTVSVLVVAMTAIIVGVQVPLLRASRPPRRLRSRAIR